MTTEPRGVSFRGCRTREQALARFETWLDTYLEEQVRIVAAGWSADDGAACDAVAFQSDLAQLRAALTRNRAASVAAFTHALDDAAAWRASSRVERREDRGRRDAPRPDLFLATADAIDPEVTR